MLQRLRGSRHQQRRGQTVSAVRRQRSAITAAFAALLVFSAIPSAVDAAAKSEVYIEDTDRFPGWKGELPQQQPLESAAMVGYGEAGQVGLTC